MTTIRMPITDQTVYRALRRKYLTASVIAAVPGLHPYVTPLQLWHTMRYGVELDIPETPAMLRGTILEACVPTIMARERPMWSCEKATEFLHDDDLRLGATPDFYCTDDEGRRVVLQSKTTTKFVFDRHWADTPPTWIALQNATEVMLDDAAYGVILVIVIDQYHFAWRLYEVPRVIGAEQRLRSMAKEFWESVGTGSAPPTDYERDADLLALMWPSETPGKVADLRSDNRLPGLLARRAELIAAAKAANEEQKIIDAIVRDKMQDAERAIIKGWEATLKVVHRKEFVVKATSYRQLRVKRDAETEADENE